MSLAYIPILSTRPSLSDRFIQCYLGIGKHFIGVPSGNHVNYSVNVSNETSATSFIDLAPSQVHAPIFTAFPGSLTVARGAAASFEATLNAPPATVAWMKDGKEVKEQAMKHRITASGNKVRCNFTVSTCFSHMYIHDVQ